MRPDHSGDAELVEKLQKRDPDCLAGLYDRYGQIVYSLLVRITHDHGIAEDLTQDLFLRVWTRGRDFDPAKGSLGVWIVSIARNMGIDYVRSAQRRFSARLRPIDQTDQLLFSYKPQGPESVIHSARVVKDALSSLNSNQKRVLELAYFEGLSQSEIAEQLQEPLGTVKSWMRAGLGRLRTAVKAGTER